MRALANPVACRGSQGFWTVRVADGYRLCRACYDERARAVYWDRDAACRARGPQNAECILDVDHDGVHEGNGYDKHGPLGRRNWKGDHRARDRLTPT